MLAKVADTYEEQVETTVTRVTALLEPFLILIMVGIVMVIILATLVPWWPVRLVFSVLTGLTLVRAFIVFHDFFHNAVTRGSRESKLLLGFADRLVDDVLLVLRR